MKIFKKLSILTLVFSFVFGFSGISSVHAASAVNLGSAGSFRILSKTAITGGAGSTITGDIGISPAGASSLTGFSQAMDPSNQFSTSSSVSGKIYAADYHTPTPASMTTAIQDMQNAYDNALVPATTVLNAGSPGSCATTCDLTGLTLVPGVYTFDGPGNVNISGDFTLSGSGVYIFQIPGNLDISSGKKIILSGALPENIFWAVAGTTTLETTSTFEGNILAGPGASTIAMQNGATLHGRALGQTDVTLISSILSGPIGAPIVLPQAGVSTGAITVVKVVVNDNGGTKTISDFPLFVNGTQVTSGITNIFNANSRYSITETSNSNYTQSFSGDCDSTGGLNLNPGFGAVCVVTNNDIGAPVVTAPVAPLIDVVKVASPLSLPAGPGAVTYTYTLRNIGTVPVTNITMVGDTCSPIVRVSGDTNNNNIVDVGETWIHTCSTTLQATHTNTVVATGWANGISAVDVASATVIVGTSVVPPLIHVTKVPSPLALPIGGGMVTYTEKVTNPGTAALSNVSLSDDKCSPVKYISGDTNNDSKLDSSETWTYTCSVNLATTTTNTVTASGQANNLISRDLAIVTVVVAGSVSSDAGCLPGNKFSITTGNACASVISDSGCSVGNKFSITTGNTCSSVSATPAVPASNLGQAIKLIATNLSLGSKGNSAKVIQQFLVSQDKGPMAKALAAHVLTTNFGTLTKAALAEWQKAVGISPASGNFGPITRTFLKSNY